MRLFVAINLPEAERVRLYDATASLRDSRLPVRWVSLDALHLTLEFLGEVAASGVSMIPSALEQAASAHPQFDLAIGGLGAFPSERNPRVVWIGIRPVPELLSLQRGVEAALAPLGFEPEARAFSPHLTIGRARRDARSRDFESFGRDVETVRYGATVTVRSVDLMRSHLGAGGPRYERIAAVPLVLSSTP